MKSADTPSEALLNAALHLLAPRRRGIEELRGRLRKKGFEAGEVANCLVWLEERDLLDDNAFSRALVRDRLRFSPRSPGILKQELTSKGIPPSVAETAVQGTLEEVGVSEAELATRAAMAWIRKQGPGLLGEFLSDRFTPERERARRRLYGFLSRRGFRGEAAARGMEAGREEARKHLFSND